MGRSSPRRCQGETGRTGAAGLPFLGRQLPTTYAVQPLFLGQKLAKVRDHASWLPERRPSSFLGASLRKLLASRGRHRGDFRGIFRSLKLARDRTSLRKLARVCAGLSRVPGRVLGGAPCPCQGQPLGGGRLPVVKISLTVAQFGPSEAGACPLFFWVTAWDNFGPSRRRAPVPGTLAGAPERALERPGAGRGSSGLSGLMSRPCRGPRGRSRRRGRGRRRRGRRRAARRPGRRGRGATASSWPRGRAPWGRVDDGECHVGEANLSGAGEIDGSSWLFW